jgi:hypothetical protein
MKNVHFYIPNQRENYVLSLLKLVKLEPVSEDHMHVSCIDGVWQFSSPASLSQQLSPASVANFIKTGEFQRPERKDFIADWIALHDSLPCNTDVVSNETIQQMFSERQNRRVELGLS